jgi:hypothetical protein
LKLVQERAGNTLEAIGLGKSFFSRTQAARQLREMLDKWDYMKFKTFCTTKQVVSKLKRPSTEWEKISANYTSEKGPITRIYRGLRKLNFPMKKWANEVNRAFSKEEVQMAKKTHEKLLTIPGHKGNANENYIEIPHHSW